MSAVMLSSVSINFYQFTSTAPTAPTAGPASATPAPAVSDHDQDERPRFRENSLVSAMMAAFQALGVGTAVASPAAGPTTNPPTTAVPTTSTPSPAPAAGATPPVAATATDPAASPTTATTPATATTATPAPTADTLETAVNEFAHALFGMLHQQGRGEHVRDGNGGNRSEGHGHRHGGHHRSGYNGFAQRLQSLAQSLGTTPVAPSAPAAVSTTSGTTPATPADTTGTTPTAASVPAVSESPSPSRGMSRLLAAFSKVMTFLQPQAASTGTTPATTPATPAVSVPSAAEQLKLFLTTLAQSFQAKGAATSPSPVGSQLNVTA